MALIDAMYLTNMIDRKTGASFTIEDAAIVINGGIGGAVLSFEGRTGAVTAEAGDYSAADVGLANVDNTSDSDKPISTLQAAVNLDFETRIAILEL